MSDIKNILEEREHTHGDFREQADVSQTLKNILPLGPNFYTMTSTQREALEMILHKIARILCGDANHEDHWDDIAGYAQLGKLKNDK